MADAYVQLAPDEAGKNIQTDESTVGGNIVEAQVVAVIGAAGYHDSYVEVAPDSTGKKVQYFKNTIGGNEVYALAVTAA